MSDETGATGPGATSDHLAPGAARPSSPQSSARPAASGERSEADWTDQVTDLIVDTVDKVRSRTTGPVLDISHSSVYALVALLVLAPVSALFLVFAVRILNWAIPGDVWFIYAGLGTIFSLLGVLLWSRRSSTTN